MQTRPLARPAGACRWLAESSVFRAGQFLLCLVALGVAARGGRCFAAGNPKLEYIRLPDLNLSSPNEQTVTALADLNGDGKLDLVRAGGFGGTDFRISVQLGNGDGTFGSSVLYPVGQNPGKIAVADVNGDGKLDVLVVNVNDKSLSVLLGNGDGSLRSQVVTPLGLSTTSLAVTDFNQDGKLDVIVTGYRSAPLEGYILTLAGNGDGTFQSPVTYTNAAGTDYTATSSVTVGDFNGDGYPDFATASPGDGNTIIGKEVVLWLNQRNGTFRRQQEIGFTGVIPGAIVAADFNRDGKLDLAITGISDPLFGSGDPAGNICVALGNGDGTMGNFARYPAGSSTNYVMELGANLAAVDMDGDGVLDLVAVASPTSGAQGLVGFLSILRGAGNGSFTPGTPIVCDYQSAWVTVADINGDDVPDVVVSGGQVAAQRFVSGVVAPAFTSVNSAIFVEGAAGSFQVSASGNPAPTFTVAGTLPSGVTLSPAGLLSGVPTSGAAGVYSVTLLASNGFPEYASQSFTLMVTKPDLLVTTAVDEDNGSPAPGLGSGTSLREALNYAATLSGPQIITFAPSLAGQTIQLTTIADTSAGASALKITSPVTIQGLTGANGITIARASSGDLRPFYVFITGSLTLNDLTVSNGSAAYGGAVFSLGPVNLNRCTLVGNHASQWGGALYNSPGPAMLVNCTIVSNSAAFTGGGIYSDNNAQLRLVHVTLAGNDAALGGGGIQGNAQLTNTIVALNTQQGSPSDISGTATGQNNLVGAGGAGGLADGSNGNRVGLTANQLLMGTLGNHGGPTPTVGLFSGSPAVNAGVSLTGLSTDQRGSLRPQFGTADIGAYELTPFDTDQTIVDAGGAYWYVGPDALGSDLHIYREVPGTLPAAVDGAAVRIGQAVDGSVLVENSDGGVYDRTGSSSGIGSGWRLLTSVTTGDGATWFLGSDGVGNDFYTYRWAAGGPPTYVPGWANVMVALFDGSILVRNSGGSYYLRLGSNAGIGSAWQGVVLANTPPTLGNPTRLAGGGFQFSFTNITGAQFTVYTSTNVSLPLNQWSNLGAPTESPAGSGHYQITDAAATNSPQRFYRVSSP